MSNNPDASKTTETPEILDASKRSIKAAYNSGKIGLFDAIPMLMIGFDMSRGKALEFLGL